MLKKHFFAKTAESSLKMSELEIFFWLTQSLNTSIQISRNKAVTKKASRTMFATKIFFNFLAKRPFFTQKWWHHQNKLQAINLYIGINLLVDGKCLVVNIRFMTKIFFG